MRNKQKILCKKSYVQGFCCETCPLNNMLICLNERELWKQSMKVLFTLLIQILLKLCSNYNDHSSQKRS